MNTPTLSDVDAIRAGVGPATSGARTAPAPAGMSGKAPGPRVPPTGAR